MSLFFYLFTFVINLWHQKFVTADVNGVFVNNQHGIQWRGKILIKKVVFEGVHGKEVDRWISCESWTKRLVNKLFKKLRDTGTVDRRQAAADSAVPALKKILSFFFRSFGSRLPLTLFCRLSDEETENIFSPVKKTKSVADCGNYWSRSLARFMRAVQLASVSSYARCLLKHFGHKSLQIIRDRDDRWITISRDMSQTVLWVWALSCWHRTISLTVSTFSSMRAQIDRKSK